MTWKTAARWVNLFTAGVAAWHLDQATDPVQAVRWATVFLACLMVCLVLWLEERRV